jgi:RND family efflux transporter MFP subunit
MPNDDLATLSIDRAGGSRRRARPGRWAAAALLLLLLAAGLWRVAHPVRRLAVTTVSLVHPSQTFTALNASGYVVAQRKAAVASKATGRLVWLGVEEGSAVREGEVIARIESADVRAVEGQARAAQAGARSNRAAARAQRDAAAAARDGARAQRAGAQAALEQARAELDDARVSADRERRLLDGGLTARAASDAAELRRRKAAAAVDAAGQADVAAEAAVRSAEGSLEAAEQALAAAGHAEEAAAAALSGAAAATGYTEIRAPFDGVVLTKNAEVGDMVTPVGSAANARAAVVTIADPASLLVEADVAETSLPKVHLGQPCEVQLDAVPGARFPAVVHMIVPTADRAKGTVLAKVRFAALDPRILPEMSAKVAFLERPVAPGEADARVAVNPRAVVERAGRPTVFLLRAGRAAAVAVTPGPRLGDLLEVRGGLAGGERALLDPPAGLADGDRVAPAEE